MSELTFEWDERYHQGILVGDYVSEIREIFSTPNDAARFARMRGRYAPSRNYVITPAGRFDIGLGNKIEQTLLNEFPDLHITKTKDYKKYIEPTYGNPTIPKLNLELRDYQHQTVTKCLDAGRGVVSLATAGGKTLIIASLLEAIYKAKKKQASMLVIVPDRGLVNQTFNDFKDYGVTFTYSKWTGDNDLDISTNVIIANLGILQSTKSDTDWIEHVDSVIVDEVHKLRRKNKVNKLIKKIHTPHKFGFTGTLPEDVVDQWNIFGKIGPLLYIKTSKDLAKENYIARAKIAILKLNYKTQPPRIRTHHHAAAAYKAEIDFLIQSKFRNDLICKVCKKANNNTLIIVDYIEHGLVLEEALKKACKGKDVYFIRGEVAVEDRDKVKNIMENKNNIVCVAISKIFSTGINIKNLHYIVFAHGGKAKIKIIQSIGRGLRLHNDKHEVIIFDMADNLYYGLQHMKKRLQLYNREGFSYGTREFEE